MLIYALDDVIKVLAWNSCRLCSQAARLAMRGVIDSAHPNLIFISEFKSSVRLLVNSFTSLGFGN